MKKELTQPERVLKHIQKYGHITSLEAVTKMYPAIVDVRSSIRHLKNDGYDIIDKWVTNKKTKSTYKVWALKETEIKKYEKTVIGG